MAFDYAKLSRPKQRAIVLVRTRNLKMARNAHAYVRGSTVKFYEWLEDGGRKLPPGPSVWICGDCHIGNLGPLADADGHVDVQIRDLDQTVIGNPVHDLVRLALSLASAARGSDLPGVTTARMLEEMMNGYEGALAGRFGGQTEKNQGNGDRGILGGRRRARACASDGWGDASKLESGIGPQPVQDARCAVMAVVERGRADGDA